ncbi:MAG: cytochrome P450, partial [Pirellula sp.]
FGRGPRTCVGQAFAMFFMKIALSELLLSKRLALDPNWQLSGDYFFAVQHPKGLSGYFANT